MQTFLQELERLVKSDLPLDEGVQQIAGEQRGTISRLAAAVEERLRAGETISEALQHSSTISPYAVALLKSGEESGAMADTLRDLVLVQRSASIARNMMMRAIRYPLIIIALFFIVISIASFTVIPEFYDLYSQLGAELPAQTRFVLNMGYIIRTKFILIVLLFVAAVFLYSLWRKTLPGQTLELRILTKLPGFGTTIYYDSMGRFCRAFGRMLKRRVPVDAAILLSGGTVNTALGKQLAGAMSGSVRQGNAISDGMRDCRMFSSSMIWVVKKSEERGEAAQAFDELADFYEEKLDDTRDMLNVTIEPLLLVILGIFLGFSIISLYLPLFNIASVIR